MLLFVTSPSLSDAQGRRCPDGYRREGGICHTFGYRDHSLRYHNGHWFRMQQPIIRYRNPKTGGPINGYAPAEGRR